MSGSENVDFDIDERPVRAAVLRKQGEPLDVETIFLRRTGPADVRIDIAAVGVCHSDLSLADGKLSQRLPAVLGHEAAGTVSEVGEDVTDIEIGDQVILLWNAPCGHCSFCLRAETHLCSSSAALASQPYGCTSDGLAVYPGLSTGAFAEVVVLPATSVRVVPRECDPKEMALLGCAVTTGIGSVVKTANAQVGASVCIIGLGGVGLSAIIGAKLAGAEVIVAVDRNDAKAALAERLGATSFLISDDDLRQKVKPHTDGLGFDVVLDCVGAASTIKQAWGLARRGGTVCVVGIGGKDEKVTFSALELFFFARTLVGSVAGSFAIDADLPQYLDWLKNGDLSLGALITSTGNLNDVNRELNNIAMGQGARGVLIP